MPDGGGKRDGSLAKVDVEKKKLAGKAGRRGKRLVELLANENAMGPLFRLLENRAKGEGRGGGRKEKGKGKGVGIRS